MACRVRYVEIKTLRVIRHKLKRTQPEDVTVGPSGDASTALRTPAPVTPATGLNGADEGLEREVKDLKTMMAQQTGQIAALGQQITNLLSEFTALKQKLG